MELILLRHSIAVGNAQHRFLGVTDTPLTMQGAALAQARAEELPLVEHVYVSPLMRARQTASLIWPEVPQTVIAGLRETDFGIFENRTHKEMAAEGDETYLAWLAQDRWEGFPGGDTFAAARVRVEAAFTEAVRDAAAQGLSRAGMVTHGGVIQLLVERYTGEQAIDKPVVKNCGGFALEVSLAPDGAVRCAAFVPLPE